ncbi:hypothetical protein [Gimesia chilikensis]|uniref:Chromosome partition protein Smc n=1 Tax=Gimesia chilikensis TaxID=2605989 RepID=A0A517PHX5_9PLAN|nr:hypothetical protein [Gimesia chilikensis]QDT18949.1 hypothetical protein HG66A1_07120 [Gimesia chilikensis]
MKKLLFHELLLLSETERSARSVKFFEDVTVIKAENDYGKSCLLKSLYMAFGATPYNVHPSWKELDVTLLLFFSVDDSRYSILKAGDQYSLFDSEDNHIHSFANVTRELGPALADLFDFHLQLINSSNNETQQATPAFLFLPYYIDQDRGWIENWSSFESLRQFKKSRAEIAAYHSGLKPNEWYLAKAEKQQYEDTRKGLRDERAVLTRVLDKLEILMKEAQFDFDIENYQKEIKLLLSECNRLKQKEENIRDELRQIESQRALIRRQIEVTEAAAGELNLDFKFLAENFDDEVECPLCGAEYHNSFGERFGIAADEDGLRSLLIDLRDELTKWDSKLDNTILSKDKVSDKIMNISEILEIKQGEVRLKDILQSEGKKEVRKVLREEKDELNLKIGEADEKIEDAELEMKKFTNRKRMKEIREFYCDRMKHFLQLLNVTALKEKDFKKIDSKIKETGSDLPRALLAYYFAILKTIEKYSSAAFCPIILDSPKQQDQDPDNWKIMLEFIRDHRPPSSQLIIGLVDDSDIDLGGGIITLSDHRQLLQKDSYDQIAKRIRPFIDASFTN